MEMTRTPHGEMLTVASDKTVSIFDGKSFSKLHSHEMVGLHFGEEGGASLHPNGNRFVAGGGDCWVRVFDRATGAELECHKGKSNTLIKLVSVLRVCKYYFLSFC